MSRRLTLALLSIATLACTASTGGTDEISPSDPYGNGSAEPDGTDASEGGGSSTGAGNSGGGVDVPGTSGGGESDGGASECVEVIVNSRPTIPEMLILLDKSASMIFEGCAALSLAEQAAVGCVNVLGIPQTPPPPHDKPFDRWAPSVAAIKGLTAQLQNKIAFGLMLFPGVEDACSSGLRSVDPTVGTADAIARTLSAAEPDGDSTPTPGVLTAARAYLATNTPVDRPVPPKYVLLVTDGAPNCTVRGINDTSNTTPRTSEAESFSAVDALTRANVQTYVIGFGTAAVPELAAALDEMARRGGTGDTAHRPVEDEQSLIAELETITAAAVSCTYTLDKNAVDPTYVRVTLDGKDIALGESGWALVDEATIELRGEACTTLQNGKDHALSIKVECDPVIVL